ncbi:hypothetical protein BX667DRAFT_504424 [Coemansia mojavensis]|nr:hypothetical protein BX667DRAFT_504424 [Coemansia mojavensis]
MTTGRINQVSTVETGGCLPGPASCAVRAPAGPRLPPPARSESAPACCCTRAARRPPSTPAKLGTLLRRPPISAIVSFETPSPRPPPGPCLLQKSRRAASTAPPRPEPAPSVAASLWRPAPATRLAALASAAQPKAATACPLDSLNAYSLSIHTHYSHTNDAPRTGSQMQPQWPRCPTRM